MRAGSGSGRPRRPGATEPHGDQDDRARQAGDEHHHAVHDGGCDALSRTQAGSAEHPRRRTLARPPAGDAGQHHGHHREQRQRQHPRGRRGGARGARGDQERDRVAEHDHRGGERDRRQRPSGQQPVADVAGRSASQPRPARAPPRGRTRPTSGHADHRRDQRDRHQRHRRPHGRGQREQDDDGEHDLHDLPGGALPRDGPQSAADIVHVAPVADATVNVADDPAGERQVEEQRPVVGRDGSGQRQADAEAARHDRPPPGTADGGQQADGRRGRQRPAVHRADALEERACAQAPDDDGERDGGARGARPSPRCPAPSCSRNARGSSQQVAPAGTRRTATSSGTCESAIRVGCDHGRHGSTSRSAWSTVTASCPASACAKRRRA